MTNCFCGMVARRKAFSLISNRGHCQRSSPSRISDTPRAGFEFAQNLSWGFVEWSCAVVITSTPRATSIISTPYELSSRSIIYLHEVIVSYTCVKPLINLWYQLHLSLTGICFPSKIFVSSIPINYPSVTTQFLYSQSLPYQLLLSTIIVSLLHRSCSGYSLQTLLSTIFISYSFLLLSATLISYL